ncbi:MAG: hypothetical protein F4Y00_07710 [Bacteroidetes bacterium SB0662_bin_6]|nr:hypothetical protein [Gammaproteobacteria bacterium]MYE04840.1 hypothetical protein [Bacteroidetes bacterium SB0662_bin_6]
MVEFLPDIPSADMSFAGQALPAPGSSTFSGVVHMHGRLEDKDQTIRLESTPFIFATKSLSASDQLLLFECALSCSLQARSISSIGSGSPPSGKPGPHHLPYARNSSLVILPPPHSDRCLN